MVNYKNSKFKALAFFKKLFWTSVISAINVFSQTWEFVPNSNFVPSSNSIFINNEEWIPKDISFYNGYTIITRSLHGVALYKDRKWTYWNSEYIKSNIINKDALNFIDFTNVNIYRALTDNNNNLCLMADKCLLKYNSSGFYCYYVFKDTNNIVQNITSLNGMDIVNNDVCCKVLSYENNNGYIELRKFNCNINNNEIKAFYEYPFGDLTHSPSIISPFCSDSNNNIYQIRDNSIVIIDSNNVQNIITLQTLFNFPSGEYLQILLNMIENKDTLIVQSNSLVLSKLCNKMVVAIDSTIYNLESIHRINSTHGWAVEATIAKKGFGKSIYFLPNGIEDISTCPTRIYKYIGQDSAVEILIPNIPGQTSPIPVSNFAVDSLGRIWLIYADNGIYIYYPEGLGIENEIEVEYYPRIWIWKLFPNPAQETARIEFRLTRDVKNDCKIEIIDILGNVIKVLNDQLVYDDYTQEATLDFSTSDIVPGTYYVAISTGKSKKLRQLQIER